MLDGCLGQLSRRDLNVGTDDGIQAAIGGDHVIGPGIQADDRVGCDVLHDKAAFAVLLDVVRVDREFQILVGDLRVIARNGMENDSPGVEHELLVGHVAAGGHHDALRGRGTAKGCVEEILAGRQAERVRTTFRGGDQLQLAVLPGDGREDMPRNAVLHRRSVGRQLRITADIARVLADRRWFLRGGKGGDARQAEAISLGRCQWIDSACDGRHKRQHEGRGRCQKDPGNVSRHVVLPMSWRGHAATNRFLS